MADRFDDRILGEKDQYYYSSDEDCEDDASDASGDKGRKTVKGPVVEPPESFEFRGGAAVHTGPKGVIQDWRRYKQLETEKRREQDEERAALAKHLALACRSYLDDEKSKEDDKAEEDEMMMLGLDQEFLKQYREQRMQEMREVLQQNRPVFGKVFQLHRDNFLEAIDKENPNVPVIIHIKAPMISACEAVDGCFACLAQEYPQVKFCSIYASDVNLSQDFMANGLPALQVYKAGTLIGNFVRLSDQLGEDFFAGDLETFLQEHSHLPSKEELAIIRGDSQDDSDLELD